jgi:hypothetical protein
VASEDSETEDPVTEESDIEDSDMEDSLDESENSSDPPSDEDRPLMTDEEEFLPEVTKTDQDVFGNFTELSSELHLNEPLYPGCSANTLEAISNLSLLAKKLNWSKDTLSGTLEMLSSMMPKNNTFIPKEQLDFFDKAAQIFHKTDRDNVTFICTKCKTANKRTKI